jgi:hypothetical protein
MRNHKVGAGLAPAKKGLPLPKKAYPLTKKCSLNDLIIKLFTKNK